ncbi:hypothetical protein IT398_02795 [Candidatus Nomurabacteria bacterium]|nr:hypothetical protein [Candidatus Nomurabacteria bacterium]
MTAVNLNIFLRRRRLFFILAFTALSFLVGYLYLVNSTVFALVSREKLVTILAAKQGAVVSLESEYLTLASGVTMERAIELGFRDAAKETIFADASPLPVLSYVGN